MPGCNKRYTDPSSLRKHVRTHGHYYRDEEKPKSKVPSTSPPTPTSTVIVHPLRTVVPQSPTKSPSMITSPPILSTQSIITGASLMTTPSLTRLMPVSPMVPTLMHIPNYTSNPLLSSTILTPMSTHTVTAHADNIMTISPTSPMKLELNTDKSSQDPDKCQDGPLDLSTSTQSDPDTEIDVVEQDSANFASSKWELLH